MIIEVIMKKIIYFLLTILIFFTFSCKSTPEIEENQVEIEKQLVETSVEPEEIEEVEEHLSETEQLLIETEGLLAEAEQLLVETEEVLAETEELLIEAIQYLTEAQDLINEMEQYIADLEKQLADMEQTQPSVQAVMPSPQPVAPAQVQPPVQVQPPELPQTETPTTEVVEEAPPRIDRSNLPSAPSTRLNSLADMGMTPLDSELVFSRIVRATVGQIVEIPFRGSGWVYLGELASRRGIVYNSRRNDPEGQSFIFSLEEAGTYTLKFYRQDFIRDYILNDHVQVIVGDAPAAASGWFNPPIDRGRVVAQPRWPSPLEEAQIRSGSRQSSEPVVTTGPAPEQRAPEQRTPEQRTPEQRTPEPARQPVVTEDSSRTQIASGTAAPVPQVTQQETASAAQEVITAEPQQNLRAADLERLPPEIILQRAQETFDAGNISDAIALLNQFMEHYPSGSDEVYWLLGQFYEANSPYRNILLSLDYYKRLTSEYPQSRRFNEARRRIAYLERFYINIQ